MIVITVQFRSPLDLNFALKTPLDAIFLGIQSNGRSLFAVDVSSAGEEEDALRILNLNNDQARFFQLREFSGSLTPERQRVASACPRMLGLSPGVGLPPNLTLL